MCWRLAVSGRWQVTSFIVTTVTTVSPQSTVTTAVFVSCFVLRRVAASGFGSSVGWVAGCGDGEGAEEGGGADGCRMVVVVRCGYWRWD